MNLESGSKILSKGKSGTAFLTPDEKSVVVIKKWNEYYGKYSDWEIFQHLALRRTLVQVLGQPDFEVLSVKNGFYTIKSAYLRCMTDKYYDNLAIAIKQMHVDIKDYGVLSHKLGLNVFYSPLLYQDDPLAITYVSKIKAYKTDKLVFLHGDPNIDNWFPGNGFIDWDYACVGPAEYDLACAISPTMADVFNFDGTINYARFYDMQECYEGVDKDLLYFLAHFRLCERYVALKHRIKPEVKEKLEAYLKKAIFLV